MKRYKFFISLIVVAFSLCNIACNGEIKIDTVNPPDAANQKGKGQTVTAPHIFMANDGFYKKYRIPAIVKTNKGTLLAFCEGRNGTADGTVNDTGDIDLVLRRSTDGGHEWSPLITVWDDGKNTCGNPVPIVDKTTGRVHLLMTWNLGTDGNSTSEFDNGKSTDTRRVWYTYSDDDGLTWAAPTEITAQAKTPDMGWYATGPCHGIILEKGEHTGRIVVPCDCHESSKGYSHALYSDDGGQSWALSNRISGNECCIAEMSDGKLVMSIRNGSGKRGLSYSTDGGATWSAPVYKEALPDPGCQGSLVFATYSGQSMLISCNPSNATSRNNLTLKISRDGGDTWNEGYAVYPGISGYSDILVLDSESLGVLYENGSTGSSQRISFVSVKSIFLF